MSQENVEMLRRAWDTMLHRDVTGLDYLDPDVGIEVSSEILPDADSYQGHAGYRAWLHQWYEAWDEVRHEPSEFEFIDGGGDLVIVVGQMHVKSRETLEMSTTVFFVYTVRDGRIARIRQVPDRAAAFRIVAAEGG